MANLFNGTSIILDQVEGALINAKDEGELSIDYSKIECFARTFKKLAGSGYQYSKFDAKPFVIEACGKCGIPSGDRETIKKILTD